MENFIYILIALAVGIIGILFNDNRRKSVIIKQNQEKIEQNKKIIDNQNNNLNVLKDHNKAVEEIKNTSKKLKKDIKEAKTDEEVNNIINDIIRLNNKRLRDK